MRFNFEASSQDNGIIFTYNKCENAIFVKREVDGSIKEEFLSATEWIKGMSFIERCGYEIGRKEDYIAEIFSIMIGVFCNFVYMKPIYMYVILTMYTGIYVIFKIYHIKHNQLSYCNKQYHSAEHMIYNLRPKEETTVEKLRGISNYSNACGSNLSLMYIMEMLLTQAIVMFVYSICCIYVTTKSEMSIVWVLIVIEIYLINSFIKLEQLEKGCFCHFQPLFLESPTDDQLELAIYGYKRAQELNKF